MSAMDPLKVTITWVAEDVQTLKPEWTLEQCQAALNRVGKHLKDRSIELGYQVLEDLLRDEADYLKVFSTE